MLYIMSSFKGEIEYWCNVKGYGLIKYNNRQALVHSSNCVREKNEWISFNRDDRVKFNVKDNIATNVKKLAGNITPDAIPSANADTPGGKVSE